jgi:hypothetical protein
MYALTHMCGRVRVAAADDERRCEPKPSVHLREEAEQLVASIERSIGWMRRTKSPETTRLIDELQGVLEEIRVALRGRGSA